MKQTSTWKRKVSMEEQLGESKGLPVWAGLAEWRGKHHPNPSHPIPAAIWGNPGTLSLGADPKKGSDWPRHHEDWGIPSKEAWGAHPVPCTLTQPSGSDQYKDLAAYKCKSGQRGVSQSICISDTHIFLKLSAPAHALCVSFFVSKIDMVITRLSGSSSRRREIPALLPFPPWWQHHIPFPFPSEPCARQCWPLHQHLHLHLETLGEKRNASSASSPV